MPRELNTNTDHRGKTPAKVYLEPDDKAWLIERCREKGQSLNVYLNRVIAGHRRQVEGSR